MAKDSLQKWENAQDKFAKRKAKKIRNYRKEVSRKASIANKRIKRLEEQGIETPALKKWKSDGGELFSIRGKNYNQVQSEMARIENYLSSATSSLTGAKKVVQEMIDNTGMDIEYKDWKNLKKQTNNFFNLASKVEQYLRTVENRASSVGYQKIWEAINRYVEKQKRGLDFAEGQVDRITSDIVKSMREFDDENYERFTGDGVDVWGWATLDKE